MTETSQDIATAWSPLRIGIFRALWLAALVSNIGTWMQDVGEAWLMTSLSSSPLTVALIQVADAIPVLFLGLPFGALADVIDRRKMLLVSQIWMFAVALTIGTLTLAGRTTSGALLLATIALGVGTAAASPAFQSIVPELVPRNQLTSAISLSGVSMNIGRVIGPAIGGAVVAAMGPGPVFIINALSFVAVAVTLSRWHRAVPVRTLPAERWLGAMRLGIRYVRYSPASTAILVRTFLFVSGGSAVWALLPVFARHVLNLGPRGYGVLMGSLGLGALFGAAALPRLRARRSPETLSAIVTMLFALAFVVLGFVHIPVAACAALIVAGFAWIGMLATFNTAIQNVAPDWVRGRLVAVYVIALQGSLAIGAFAWGAVAARTSVGLALLAAGAWLVAGIAIGRAFRIDANEHDLTPSRHWGEPVVDTPVRPGAGPVLTEVEYRVDEHQSREFLASMQARGRVRRRNGAIQWAVFRDTSDASRFIEVMVSESWGDHLLEHERVSVADREIEERALAFHRGDAPPKVTHWVGTDDPND